MRRFDVGSFFTGLVAVGGALIAIACAPASAFVGAAYGLMCAGSAIVGVSSGTLMGYGLTH